MYFFWRHVNISAPALWNINPREEKGNRKRKCQLKYCTKFVSEMWHCLRPYSVVLIALCLVVKLGLFISPQTESTFSEVKNTMQQPSVPRSQPLTNSFCPCTLLFLYRQKILNEAHKYGNAWHSTYPVNTKNKTMNAPLAHSVVCDDCGA